jgi:hypothetical protein
MLTKAPAARKINVPATAAWIDDRVKSPFPVSSYIGTVEVFESFDSMAVVVWTVEFESTPEHSASVRTTLENGIGDGLLGMKANLGG